MNRRNAVITVIAVAAALLVSHLSFFFFRDNFSTHYPMKVISASLFRGGEIPWWNFHDMGGQPLAGNPNALTFYPDNVLYLFLPAHVAFNLHFLIHLAGGLLAMRALCRARGAGAEGAWTAAAIWTLSGAVISSTAFYNLVTAAALIPLALLAVEKRSARLLGCAFGLLLLGSEPVTILGTALAVGITASGRMRWRSLAAAALLAACIGAPQIVAYSEIAGEVERSVPISPRAMLATSLTGMRVVELVLWPVHGFLNDPGGLRQRLFSTLFLGIIVVPALITRSRYVAVAAACLFLALGANNPLVAAAVEVLPLSLRAFRFPEKLALPLTAALVVLIAAYLTRTRYRRLWMAVTLLPLTWAAFRALPVDWFAPYRVAPRAAVRVHWRAAIPPGVVDARTEYRQRAAALDWMFGAVANLRYGVGRSPDLMHSLLSRAVAQRFQAIPPRLKERYLRVNGCDVPGALPMTMIVAETIAVRSLGEAVRQVESPRFDEQRIAVAPPSLAGFTSAAGRVTRYEEDGQTIRVDVVAEGPLLLMVNQTFFEAWVARSGRQELETFPLNIDRLGVLVPAGEHRLALTFGRRRAAVVVAWIGSMLLLLASAFPGLVEKLDGRAGKIKRAADEEGADL
ncbi:MAG TPA: hypothetical protein VNA04_12590 [Thermoanaerobaculia bacterium]|nr:hypothetical protein [Thermoanaerobaculia bacterium]